MFKSVGGSVPTGIGQLKKGTKMHIVFAQDTPGAPAPVAPKPSPILVERTAPMLTRSTPWGTGMAVGNHRRGEQSLTSREALKLHDLDWRVGLGTIMAQNPAFPELHNVEAQRHRVVQRMDSGKVLGIVSPQYGVIQNRRLAEFNDTLVEASGGEVASMGSAFDDRKVWAVTQLGDIDSPDGGLGSFLVTVNSHDGGSSMFTTVVNVRWACTNGLIGLSDMAYTVRIRHSSKVEERMAEAQRVLVGVSSYLTDTTRIMEELLATPVSRETGEGLIRHALLPLPDIESEQAERNAVRKQNELITNWMKSDNLEDVRFTGWGFVNAVSEWNEWTGSHVRRRRLSPMERLINDTGQDIVHQARELVLA